MKIEIHHNHPTSESNYNNPTSKYHVRMWDGPDGIDELSTSCATLGECFEQIVIFRTLLAKEYV
jgi:hypothetical protein